MSTLKSVLETILFAYGEQISLEKLSKLTKSGKEEVRKALNELSRDYEERGIVLLKRDEFYQLGTSPNNSSYLQELAKDEFGEELSKAALETLSIIAYKGPITRAKIEFIRGVNSSFILRNLLMRGLIERIENPKDARSPLYQVSFQFLKYLGLKNINELPEYDMLRKEKKEAFNN